MRADASEAAQAKCTYMATTLRPSSAALSSTVAASIREATVIKKISASDKRFSNFSETSLHACRRRMVNTRSGSGADALSWGSIPACFRPGIRRLTSKEKEN